MAVFMDDDNSMTIIDKGKGYVIFNYYYKYIFVMQ